MEEPGRRQDSTEIDVNQMGEVDVGWIHLA
jgi:hypothetical protein